MYHLYGFRTSVLVCDGASSNVSALKSTCGVSGAYGVHTFSSNKRSGGPSSDKHDSEPSLDKHEVKPWFAHPFDPDANIFWMICPSHQMSLHNAWKYFVIYYCNFFTAQKHDKCFAFITELKYLHTRAAPLAG